jgi:hypothetical protein
LPFDSLEKKRLYFFGLALRAGLFTQTFLQSKKVTAATPHAESRLEVD